jgi:hypothetical protein
MATTPKVSTPAKMPSRSKPSAALARSLKADANATVVKTATVTAVRWDGSVNLQMGGQHYVAVACNQGYQDRQPGDRVQVIMHGGMPFVLGSIGGDPDSSVPEIFPTDTAQYTWGLNNTSAQDQKIWANDGQQMRVGRPGSIHPTYPGDTYYMAAWSYWDGAANQLNDDTMPTTSIDVFVARTDWDEGDPGAAYFTLWGHKMDALPNSPQSLLLNVALTPASIDFTLEAGEVKIITLPDTWRDNIGAAVLDANTIRGFLITPQAPDGEPWAVDNSYAVFNNMTCGARVYTQ